VQPDICPIKFISSLLGMTFISRCKQGFFQSQQRVCIQTEETIKLITVYFNLLLKKSQDRIMFCASILQVVFQRKPFAF